MTTRKAPTGKTVLRLEFAATKETPGTVRYDMTEESVEANGGRGTNIYLPKSMIKQVEGGLRPNIEIHVVLPE